MFKNPHFPEIHGKFAFGCMRLPTINEEIDIPVFKDMVDAFIAAGFNYFDTAHGYHNGRSELALKEALTSRYPREKFLLTNKLTEPYFHCQEDIRPFFQSQLDACGVEYFDFYLMHAQNARNYVHFKNCRAYETAFELKKEGKIRHVGISFHDSAEVLDRILTENPDLEVVQIQFNYLDYDDPNVQSRACYEVCVKHNKPILIMEPVKGGSLVKLPEAGQKAIDECNKDLGVSHSNASYALRFAAGFPQVACVLSGMSNMDQIRDNVSFMADFKALSERELSAIAQVVGSYRNLELFACTSCHYCVEENHCPMQIRIPEFFACYNAKKAFHEWNQDRYYQAEARQGGAAKDCIECRGCESVCPQSLPIVEYLKKVSAEFDS